MPTLEAIPRLKKANELFGDVEISEKDLARYKKLVEDGKEGQAIDEFIAKYITPYIERYQTTAQSYLQQAQSGQFSREDQSNMERNIVLLGIALSTLLNKNFESFLTESYAPTIFENTGVTTAKLRKAILDQTLSQFDDLIRGAMSSTQANVLNYVRTLQREMIIQNQRIIEQKLVGDLLSKSIREFRASLQQKFPDIYGAIEEGKILKSRLLANGKIINYNLANYSEMSISTTLLNVDRTATEVIAGISGDEVLEYYLRDDRVLKTEARAICQHILRTKTNGKSLLATNEDSASEYGIMTLSEAKGQGAMGINCRHSVRRVSKSFMKSISEEAV